MAMTAVRKRPAAGVARRAVVAVALEDLRGPASGVLEPPRRLWWSGKPEVDFGSLGQVAVFYESVLDVGSPADYAEWLNAELLAELWPSLGMRDSLRAAFESLNPQLGDVSAPVTAAA